MQLTLTFVIHLASSPGFKLDLELVVPPLPSQTLHNLIGCKLFFVRNNDVALYFIVWYRFCVRVHACGGVLPIFVAEISVVSHQVERGRRGVHDVLYA